MGKYQKGMIGALPEPELFQSLLEVTHRDLAAGP